MQKIKEITAIKCNEGENTDYIVDVENREIYITGIIDDSLIPNVIKPILDICSKDEEEGLAYNERMPITLYFASSGGDITAGLALIDTIKMSPTPIVGIAISRAYSMACVILACCHYRIAFPHSSLMLHDGYSGIQTSTSKFFDVVDFMKKQEKQVKDLIIENTKIPRNLLQRKYHTDWFLTPQEAVELGIVDMVLEYPKIQKDEIEALIAQGKEIVDSKEENKEVE